MKKLGALCCVLVAACSSPVTPFEDSGVVGDAGGGGGSGGGAGAGGGSGASDAGPDGGGPDSGIADSGCTSTAAQLAFVSAPQTLDARVCSAPLKVHLQSACGTPVTTAQPLTVAFTASGASTEIFGDGACIGTPSSFEIPAGASSLDVFFRDAAPGTSTISVTAAGLDGGSQLETFVCATGEKACNGTSCIPTASCCNDPDCPSPRVCVMGQCKVPSCQGFVNGCTTFVGYDGGNIVIGSPFNPKCARMSVNTTVKFTNSGTTHPLEQLCGPRDVSMSNFASTVTVTGLSSFGTYGFRCANHPTFEIGALKTP